MRHNELSVIDEHIMKSTKETIKKIDGQYEVHTPLKGNTKLKNNYEMALTRLKSTERKLDKNPEVNQLYGRTIEKYLEKGYINEIKDEEPESAYNWYLPHFPIVKLDRATTNVRIVFDAAAKFKNKLE